MPKAPKITPERKSKLRQDILNVLNPTTLPPTRPVILNVKKVETAAPKIETKKIEIPAKPSPKPAVAIKKETPAPAKPPLIPKKIITIKKETPLTIKPPRIKKQPAIIAKERLVPKTTKKAPSLPEPQKLIAPPSTKAKWLKIILSIAVVLALIVLALALDILGMYQWGIKDDFSLAIAKTFNLPAGTVNGETILMADYLTDVKILKTTLALDREGSLSALTDGKNMSDQVFNRLTTVALIFGQLKKYNQTISEQEINEQMDKIIAQFSDQQKAATTIKQLYNLDLNQFKENILKPLLAKDKLQKDIVGDESLDINKKAKIQAENILRLALEPTADFSALANTYTQDESSVNIGGDLGLVSPGELAPEIEQVIFSTPENTVYNQLIKNSFGYHIVKVNKILIDEISGKKTVKAQHILIKINVDEYLKDVMDQATIKKFIKN